MNDDLQSIRVESTLPKPWEEETTFNDILYDWMSRAPWLAISAVTHVMVFLLLAVIPWSIFSSDPEQVIEATLAKPLEDVFEDLYDQIQKKKVLQTQNIERLESLKLKHLKKYFQNYYQLFLKMLTSYHG